VGRRTKQVLATPKVVAALAKRSFLSLYGRARGRNGLIATALMLGAFSITLAVGIWERTAPYRAAGRFAAGDYDGSAALFEALGGTAGRYDAANAHYSAGSYERAFALYGSIDAADPALMASVWFNRGNTLVRLKEFAKAREAYARSLALRFDEAALENMMNILDAESQDHMLTGRQEGKKRVQEQEEPTAEERHEGQRKEGGGNDRQNAADRNRGAGGEGKKVERDMQLEFSNQNANRLSSRQYELINQRSVNETKPW